MARGSQHHTSLSLSAKIHGDIGKDMQKGVEAAQAGVRRGQRSGGKGQESESSKGKRRFGNMMFEASRAAEDFGQQLSVSFDQAVRASANNITQMVAVSGNQYAAMATSVAVALYFMAKPLAELANLTRQWGDELAIVDDKIKRVKKTLSEGIQLREFEQGLLASLMPADQRPDQWETQKKKLEEELGDLRKRRAEIDKLRKDTINAPRDPRDMGFGERLSAAWEGKTEKEKKEEHALMLRMSEMSESELTRLETARLRLMKAQRRPANLHRLPPGPRERAVEEARKAADAGLKEWQSVLNELDMGAFADTSPDTIKKLTAELQKAEGVFKSLQREGRESVNIAEQEELIRKRLAILAKHDLAIQKRRLAIDKEKLSTLQTMRTTIQEGSKQEYDLLRGLDFEGYGNTSGPGIFATARFMATPDAPVGGAAQDSFGANSGLRRLPNGRLISTGTRDPWQGEEGFALRAGRIAGGIGGAGFRSGQNVPRERDWAASGIGVRQPRTAREWREIGVRHESVGQAPNQPGRWIMHRQPGSEFLDPEIVQSSPWQRMPMGWGARGGSGRPGDPLHRILSGTIHTAEDWDRRETRGPLRQTGLTEREKRRFRASRGGGTASDTVTDRGVLSLSQFSELGTMYEGWGSGAMGGSLPFGGSRVGAAFVPAYPGSRAGSIGTSPSSSGMTPSQNRLLDSFWTGSGYQRSRYGAAADLDVQRGADLQLDAEHPVMSPRDQMQRDRNFEIEEQSSQYLKSISDNTARLAQERRAKTVTISGGP